MWRGSRMIGTGKKGDVGEAEHKCKESILGTHS